MKNKSKKKKKGFDTVKFFRKVKTRISKEIYGMNYEQLIAYFDKAPEIFPRRPGESKATS